MYIYTIWVFVFQMYDLTTYVDSHTDGPFLRTPYFDGPKHLNCTYRSQSIRFRVKHTVYFTFGMIILPHSLINS